MRAFRASLEGAGLSNNPIVNVCLTASPASVAAGQITGDESWCPEFDGALKSKLVGRERSPDVLAFPFRPQTPHRMQSLELGRGVVET